MEYADLAPEQKERIDACKTPEEVLAFAQEEGITLTDEQLEMVSGGYDLEWNPPNEIKRSFYCKSCGEFIAYYPSLGRPTECPNCGEDV